MAETRSFGRGWRPPCLLDANQTKNLIQDGNDRNVTTQKSDQHAMCAMVILTLNYEKLQDTGLRDFYPQDRIVATKGDL